jgi:hypothetical protein
MLFFNILNSENKEKIHSIWFDHLAISKKVVYLIDMMYLNLHYD